MRIHYNDGAIQNQGIADAEVLHCHRDKLQDITFQILFIGKDKEFEIQFIGYT